MGLHDYRDRRLAGRHKRVSGDRPPVRELPGRRGRRRVSVLVTRGTDQSPSDQLRPRLSATDDGYVAMMAVTMIAGLAYVVGVLLRQVAAAYPGFAVACRVPSRQVNLRLITPVCCNVTRRGEEMADMGGYRAFGSARAIYGGLGHTPNLSPGGGETLRQRPPRLPTP